jgi:hypothetical protein
MSQVTRNRTLIILVLAFPFIIAVVCLIYGSRPPPPTNTPLPNPNGYDKFVKAAGRLQGRAGDFETMSQSELTSLIASNSAALALARSAFTNECRVPVQYNMSYLSSQLKDMAGFKRLAQTLAAEGRLAELENRTNDAARCYLDDIHFGIEARRGGLLINALVGVAIEYLGRTSLQRISGELDAKTCRKAALALESFETNRQSWSDIMQQEDLLRRHLYPGLKGYVIYLSTYIQAAKVDRKAGKKFEGQEVETSRLMIQLAARAFELEKGHPPANISDLVPDYLKAIPQEPATSANMVLPP